MSYLVELIKAYIPRVASQEEQDLDELNASVDIYDLERRMYAIDHRQKESPWQVPSTQFPLH